MCAGESVVPKARCPFSSHQLLRHQDTLRAPEGHRLGDQDSSGLSEASVSLSQATHTHPPPKETQYTVHKEVN